MVLPPPLDAYLAASGVLQGGDGYKDSQAVNLDTECGEDAEASAASGARRMFVLAQEMLRVCSETQAPDGSGPIRIRIGLHVGPVVAAIVGTQMLRYAHLCAKHATTSPARSYHSNARVNNCCQHRHFIR